MNPAPPHYLTDPELAAQLEAAARATRSVIRLRDLAGALLLVVPADRFGDERWPRASRARPRLDGEPICTVELMPAEGDGRAPDALALAVRIVEHHATTARREDLLCHDLLRSYQHLSFYYEMADQLGESLDVRRICNTVLERAADLLGAHFGVLRLVREQDGFRSLALGEEPSQPQDGSSDVLLQTPLGQGEPPLGVLTLVARGDRRFTAQDKKLLQSVTAMASLALRHSALAAAQRESLLGAVHALAASIEARDPYTRGHSERVAELSAAIGEALGLPEEVLDSLHLGGLLHDIGKIAVPEFVLFKPGALDPRERALVEAHTTAGVELLQRVNAQEGVQAIVLHHHERVDGGGYPNGLLGGQIPLSCRIIAVADAVDAMLSRRAWRREWPIERVVGELSQGSGRQFDPEVVEAFVRRVLPSERFRALVARLPYVAHPPL